MSLYIVEVAAMRPTTITKSLIIKKYAQPINQQRPLKIGIKKQKTKKSAPIINDPGYTIRKTVYLSHDTDCEHFYTGWKKMLRAKQVQNYREGFLAKCCVSDWLGCGCD